VSAKWGQLQSVLTVRDSRRLDWLAQALVVSGLVQALVGTVLFSLKANYRIFYSQVDHANMIGTFVNRNHMAGYLCMCLSVGIGLMLARLGTHKVVYANWRARVVALIAFTLSAKMRLRLLLVVMVIALVLTTSRMGNAAFFTALLVTGVVALVVSRHSAPHTMFLIASLVAVDILVVGAWIGLDKVVERIQETSLMSAAPPVAQSSVKPEAASTTAKAVAPPRAVSTAESVEARTAAARQSIPIVQDFPLFGTGGGSYYGIFLGYRAPSYGYAFVDHAHNDYVEIAADFGLLGLGLLGTLVASSLWTALKVMRRRKYALPWGLAFGVTMSIVALMLHSTVDFNLQIPSNALTMVVILSMAWLTQALPSPKSRRKHDRKEEPHEPTQPTA
jgi:O-antigen ligase